MGEGLIISNTQEIQITRKWVSKSKIDSSHPWPSPSGRLALLDVSLGNPAQ
jgi:hypothetical protein